MKDLMLAQDAEERGVVPIASSPTLYIEDVETSGLATSSVGDRLFDITEEIAESLRATISRSAVALRPDLKEIGASKATVKFGVKAVVKNGKLTSWVSEVGAEGSIEVSIEFVATA